MHVIEYIQNFLFNFSFYLPWDYYAWLKRVIFILLRYKVKTKDSENKMAAFTSKEYQIIKILRNGLGIVFLIFQRLI